MEGGRCCIYLLFCNCADGQMANRGRNQMAAILCHVIYENRACATDRIRPHAHWILERTVMVDSYLTKPKLCVHSV